jgi:hypothetical protein
VFEKEEEKECNSNPTTPLSSTFPSTLCVAVKNSATIPLTIVYYVRKKKKNRRNRLLRDIYTLKKIETEKNQQQQQQQQLLLSYSRVDYTGIAISLV